MEYQNTNANYAQARNGNQHGNYQSRNVNDVRYDQNQTAERMIEVAISNMTQNWPQHFPNVFNGRQCLQCLRASKPFGFFQITPSGWGSLPSHLAQDPLMEQARLLQRVERWLFENLKIFAKGMHCPACGRGSHFFLKNNQDKKFPIPNQVHNQFQNPNQVHNPNQFRNPNQVHNPNQFRNPNQFQKPQFTTYRMRTNDRNYRSRSRSRNRSENRNSKVRYNSKSPEISKKRSSASRGKSYSPTRDISRDISPSPLRSPNEKEKKRGSSRRSCSSNSSSSYDSSEEK